MYATELCFNLPLRALGSTKLFQASNGSSTECKLILNGSILLQFHEELNDIHHLCIFTKCIKASDFNFCHKVITIGSSFNFEDAIENFFKSFYWTGNYSFKIRKNCIKLEVRSIIFVSTLQKDFFENSWRNYKLATKI